MKKYKNNIYYAVLLFTVIAVGLLQSCSTTEPQVTVAVTANAGSDKTIDLGAENHTAQSFRRNLIRKHKDL